MYISLSRSCFGIKYLRIYHGFQVERRAIVMKGRVDVIYILYLNIYIYLLLNIYILRRILRLHIDF